MGSDDETNWQFAILKNRYIILKKIGTGGFASVWLTYDMIDLKYYAIKISNNQMYNICMEETKIYEMIKKYECKHLIDIVTSFNLKNDKEIYHCNVMELMGQSTYDYIKENNKMDLTSVIKCIKHVLIGLDVLHSNGIIHGDVKPENIMMIEYHKELKGLIERIKIEKIIFGKLTAASGKKWPQNKEKIIDHIKKKLLSIQEESTRDDSDDSSDCEEGPYSYSDADTNSDLLTICSEEEEDNRSLHSAIVDNEFLYIDDLLALWTENEDDGYTNRSDLFKLIDMGGCIIQNQKMRKQAQTSYYMAPEILLRLPYDESSDMWALGCTIYELLTGNILFNPDKYWGNEDRYHLYLITQRLGKIPEDIIKESAYKDIFFTHDMRKVKGFQNIENKDLVIELKNILKSEREGRNNHADKTISLITRCLKYHKGERISAREAVKIIGEI